MNNKGKKIHLFVAFILVALASTSCTNNVLNQQANHHSKNISSLYPNLRNINKGQSLVVHFNIQPSQPQTHTNRHQNNAKINTVSTQTIQSKNHQLATKKLAYRN